MTDLLLVLPDFSTGPFANVLPSLERSNVRVSDLLSLDPPDVARHAQIPTREVRRLTDAIVAALRRQLSLPDPTRDISDGQAHDSIAKPSRSTVLDLENRWRTITCLDESLDHALAGGIPAGYLTELTGESGAGKTHVLLTLLLAVQLPSPRGLGRNALYISTEAPLATSRLSQLLAAHPILTSLPAADRPSLNRILSISTPDLEAQEHIIRYQLPVAVKRHNIGLVVIDSITANFRAEFDHRGNASGSGGMPEKGPAAMARRSAQLIELGSLLRNLAREQDVAVVVANQVADRFSHPPTALDGMSSLDASQPTSSASAPPSSDLDEESHDPMTLDHQQRWFTGWGDAPPNREMATGMKTPSLGLVWTNQLACRIALTRRLARGSALDGGGMRWKRHARVVFAPWAKDDGGQLGTEFTIAREGVIGAREEHDQHQT